MWCGSVVICELCLNVDGHNHGAIAQASHLCQFPVLTLWLEYSGLLALRIATHPSLIPQVWHALAHEGIDWL